MLLPFPERKVSRRQILSACLRVVFKREALINLCKQWSLLFILQDDEMQQKIDYEIKMREGTARLLAASKHPAQLLEAAKNLLTSNTRIIAYMAELQRRKTAQVLGQKYVSVATPIYIKSLR